MPDSTDHSIRIAELAVPLDRDLFLRKLVRHLAGALQDVVGLDEAAGFVSIVGQRMGDEIGDAYKAALDTTRLDRHAVRDVCLDLKRRIEGDFYVIEEDDEKIVFGNRACPFAEQVIGRGALCMMTSNVFGTIAAQNLGYGKVALEETFANGDGRCRVVLYLKRTAASDAADGREYLRAD